MANTEYTYSISEDFPFGKVATDRLTQEIEESSITIALDYINTNGDDCDIWFKAELPTADETKLDTIVSNHSGEPLPQPTQDVKITSVNVASDEHLPITAHGFQDLTGYNVYRKGYHFVADPYTTTQQQAKYTSNMMLQGLQFRMDGNVRRGDYVEVEMVDSDNMLGYGAGLVLAQFASTIYVYPEMEFECICDDVKTLPAGIYVRFSYYSYDPNNSNSSSSSSLPEVNGVHICLEHALRTCPA